VGMMVAVFGVGYAIAATNPLRHWPIVLVGLLGKVLGPIGFLHAALAGQLPWSFGWINLTNDLIWWLPFALILRRAWHEYLAESGAANLPLADASPKVRSQQGTDLHTLSMSGPLLVIFLRHLG